MKDATITQAEPKAQDGFLATLHYSSYTLLQKYLRGQDKRLMPYLLKPDY